jgi:hypothetical protein
MSSKWSTRLEQQFFAVYKLLLIFSRILPSLYQRHRKGKGNAISIRFLKRLGGKRAAEVGLGQKAPRRWAAHLATLYLTRPAIAVYETPS